MNSEILKLKLFNKKDLEELNDYCIKNTLECMNNANMIGKKALKLSGYKEFPEGLNYAELHNEFERLSRQRKNTVKPKDLFRSDNELLSLIKRNGSDNIRAFIFVNGRLSVEDSF